MLCIAVDAAAASAATMPPPPPPPPPAQAPEPRLLFAATSAATTAMGLGYYMFGLMPRLTIAIAIVIPGISQDG